VALAKCTVGHFIQYYVFIVFVISVSVFNV